MNTNQSPIIYFYEEAILPKTFYICGIELKPFCLGHLILLQRINSPLMEISESEVDLVTGLYDFYMALAICALTYENGIKLLKDDEYAKKVIDSITEAIQLNMKTEGAEWNIYSKTNTFKEYMQYFFEMPTYSVEQKKPSTPTGLDWKIGICQVFKKLGYTDTEVFNMSLRRLFYEWCSFMESEGGIKVFNGLSQEPAKITIGESESPMIS